jgi:hypothetical protein
MSTFNNFASAKAKKTKAFHNKQTLKHKTPAQLPLNKGAMVCSEQQFPANLNNQNPNRNLKTACKNPNNPAAAHENS